MRNALQFSIRLLSICLLVSILLNCSQQQKSNAKNILRTTFYTEPQTLDPRKGRDVSSSIAQRMIFEGLTYLSKSGDIQWAQASHVRISEDGLIYRFYLRDSYWTDGAPVTADDFEYAWKKSLSPSFGSSCSFLLENIANAPAILRGELPIDALGVQAIDRKILEVRLSQPTPYFLSLISACAFLPIPKHVEMEDPQWIINPDPQKLVSNGPFKLAKWQRNVLFEVKKNPTYWDHAHVQLQGIHAYIIADEHTCLQMFEKNDIDYINSCMTPLALDSLQDLQIKKRLQIIPYGGTRFCAFNLNNPYLKNRNIRTALSLSIDRQSIVANISQQNEIPASRFLPPILASNKDLHLLELYNPSLANMLLEQGLAEEQLTLDQMERDVTLMYENSQENGRIAQAIQQQWKQALGLTVDLLGLEDVVQQEKLERKDYSITLDFWAAHYMDPSCILNRFKMAKSKKNYPGYENEEYISLLEQAEQMLNPAIRNALLERAEAIIANDMPLAPIFHFNMVSLQNDRFESIASNPVTGPIFKNIRAQ